MSGTDPDVESQVGIAIDMRMEMQPLLDDLRPVAAAFYQRWQGRSPYADTLWQVYSYLQAVVASGEHGLPLTWSVQLASPEVPEPPTGVAS